jgi:hypothetical protein
MIGDKDMFKGSAAGDKPAAADVLVLSELVPVSTLGLDVELPAGVGWRSFLASKGVAVLTDEVGRLAVSVMDARRLIQEQHELEASQRAKRARLNNRRLSGIGCGGHRCRVVSRRV